MIWNSNSSGSNGSFVLIFRDLVDALTDRRDLLFSGCLLDSFVDFRLVPVVSTACTEDLDAFRCIRSYLMFNDFKLHDLSRFSVTLFGKKIVGSAFIYPVSAFVDFRVVLIFSTVCT